MLPVNDVQDYIAKQIDQGETDLGLIEEKVYRRFRHEVDAEEAIRAFCSKRASLAITQFRNDAGERLAFAIRDGDGTRRLAHLGSTTDADLILAIATKYDNVARSAIDIRDRAMAKYHQMDMFAAA